MVNDAELLRRYAREAAQDAFTELVARNIGLVYSVALRRTQHSQRAEDVTQIVFNDLARKAATLCQRSEIASWLHVSAHYAATALIRAEVRRARREQDALMATDRSSPDELPADWDRIRPVLDAVLCELKETDRAPLLLRFFQNHSFAEIGRALGLGEEAARKRVDRALAKLHARLSRRGITSTAALLSLTLAAQGSAAAPVGLGTAVAATAMTEGAAAAVGMSTLTLMTTTKIALGIAGGLTVLAFGAGMYLAGKNAATRLTQVAVADSSRTPVTADAVASPSPASVSTDRPHPSPHSRENHYRQLIDQLRRAGISEDLVRLFVRANLESDLAKEKAQLMTKLQFWRETLTPDMVEAMRKMQADNKALVALFFGSTEALKGLDSPLNARSYPYLPLEVGAKVEQIRNDYLDLRNAVAQTAGSSPADRTKQLALLDEQEQADLAKILTPGRLDDYAMRNSPVATQVARYLSPTDATDTQFKDIFKLYQTADSAPQPAALAQLAVFDGAQKILAPAQFYSYLEASDPAFVALKTTTDQLSLNPTVAVELARYLVEAQASHLPPATAATKLIETLGPDGARAFQSTPAGRWLGKFLPRS